MCWSCKSDLCVIFGSPDKGGDGGDGGGCAGAAGSERSPSEVEGGLSRQVFGAGPVEEGGSSTERAGEGQSRSSPSSVQTSIVKSHLPSPRLSLFLLSSLTRRSWSRRKLQSLLLCASRSTIAWGPNLSRRWASRPWSAHFLSLNPSAAHHNWT